MKIYLAGSDKRMSPSNFAGRQLAAGNVDNIFFSAFAWIKNPNGAYDLLSEIKSRNPRSVVVIDSGAHSFFTATSGVSATGKISQRRFPPSEYMKRYLAWIKKNYKLIDFFVELDIGELVGQSVVDAWYGRIAALGMADKCIRVYHPAVVSEAALRGWFDNAPSRYVGLEGVRANTSYRIDYRKLCRQSYDSSCRVHGFAMVRKAWVLHAPFYSVDSMGWQSSHLYGKTPVPSLNGFQKYVDDTRPVDASEVSMLSAIKREYGSLMPLDVSMVRAIMSARYMERTVTSYWEKRGVVWQRKFP